MMYGGCQYLSRPIYGNLLEFVWRSVIQWGPEVGMVEAPKSKTTVWIDQEDRGNMKTIRRVYRLASDSAAIRYALQQVARAARAEEAR